MQIDQSGMVDGYASVIDSELGATDDGRVIGIDAHLDDSESDDRPDQYHSPKVTPETLGEIQQQLETLGQETLATMIQTRKHQLEDNQSALYFSANQLSEIAITLSIALAKSQFFDDTDAVYAITQFGKSIAWSTDRALLAESVQFASIPRVKPTDGMSFIDPFAVIADNQPVVFTNGQGNELEADDIDE